jgi:NDP-sugar pyrophosphorylase family protein
MQDLTLVVMAAGMGSRFGGPKQITPVGPSKEFIIDYSIYDAIKAGFNKIVFIIKKEHREIFKETIDKRIKDRVKIEYVYQELENIPKDVKIPEERVKPWGTDHAILCAKEKITGPFVIINADDFYGRDAYKQAINFINESTDPTEGAVISYPYGVTSSEYGSVKRAVIELDGDYITKLTESKIATEGNIAKCQPLDGSKEFTIELDHPVSMNLFCFKKEFLELLENDFNEFIHGDKETLLNGELVLSETAQKYLQEGKLKLKNIVSSGLWTGVTYKEDLPKLQETIKKLISEGEYPDNLWDI